MVGWLLCAPGPPGPRGAPSANSGCMQQPTTRQRLGQTCLRKVKAQRLSDHSPQLAIANLAPARRVHGHAQTLASPPFFEKQTWPTSW